MPVKVLMVSWEYPPLVYGGLGRHVHGLALGLAAGGHAVTVVAPYVDGAPARERVDGVDVVRAEPDPLRVPLTDLLAFVLAGGHALLRAALAAGRRATYDVVHAHDWVVAPVAVAAARLLGLPLVATLHATEAGRHQGWLPGELSRTIWRAEWWLTHSAARVLTCSAAMRGEVSRALDLPARAVHVVPNGIDPTGWRQPPGPASAGPQLVVAARLEYEKGVHDVLAALPRLRRRHPGLRLVVAGEGTYAEALRAEARRRRLSGAVSFAGRLEQADLAALLAASDVALVPSRYEPFGLAALEAAAAGTPRVVAATGGLVESVTDGVDGLVVPPADPAALAHAVDALLTDPVRAARLAAAARARLAEHDWARLAARTAQVYTGITPRPDPGPPPEPPTGNLLTGEMA